MKYDVQQIEACLATTPGIRSTELREGGLVAQFESEVAGLALHFAVRSTLAGRGLELVCPHLWTLPSGASTGRLRRRLLTASSELLSKVVVTGDNEVHLGLDVPRIGASLARSLALATRQLHRDLTEFRPIVVAAADEDDRRAHL